MLRIALCAALSFALPFSAGAGEALRALILSGQNNHNWRATTPVLRRGLEQTGRFRVEVLEHPDRLTADLLENFDVIISNWNHFGKNPLENDWPDIAKQALLAFVGNGGGYVSVHAGSSSFYDWPAYHELSIATWAMGQTGHGSIHTFTVEAASPNHPVTQGMRPFAIQDELWHRAGVQHGAEVLATAFSTKESGGSGSSELVLLARPFGKGSSINLLLGHHERSMSHPVFAALLARSAEYAATGNVTVAWPEMWPANAEEEAAWRQTLKETRRPMWAQSSRHLALAKEGETLWQLHFDPKEDTIYVDPLAPVDGPSLTWNAPPDHPWHHGLWFSWKYINGLNYWEKNPETGRPDGKTVWDPPVINTHPDGSAEAVFALQYQPKPGETVLNEIRKLRMAAPDETGTYHIDWESVFEAQVDEVQLDRTPIEGEPNGVAWGGYAGLSARLAPLDAPAVHADTGLLDTHKELNNLDAEAIDYSGRFDGKLCGIAILQFPDSGIHPSPWYVITQPQVPFYYFSPAVIYRSPRVLKKGERLKLHYRVVVHRERWDSGKLEGELAALSSTKGDTP
jgi:type 1 glutamine amidotransferase